MSLPEEVDGEAKGVIEVSLGSKEEPESPQESLSTQSEEQGNVKEEVEEEQDGPLLVETPSISMSAGADPWADPSPVAAMASALSSSSKRTDNPWATNALDHHAEESSLVAGRSVASHQEKSLGQASIQSSKGVLNQDDRWGEFHLPKLGNAVARYWSFKPGLLQLNSGSYGSCPRPVCDTYKALQDRQEENPDVFRRVHMENMLRESRAKVAKIINCQTENVVLISNATTGTNAVLRDLIYKTGDAILYFSFTYNAVKNNIDYLIEMEQMRGVQLTKVQVDLHMPLSKTDILLALRAAIEEAKSQGKRIVVGVIDTISSNPGLALPWQDMVKVLKEHQILSLVDGAHGIGQISIDLSTADPDFFVSNCHKWFYAHRGCALLYVAPRNLHLQRSCLPTSHSYTRNPSQENNTWALQWASPGTLDVSSLLSIDAALEFRQMLGGEERIMAYNHDLAVRGGAAAAQILDTCVLDLPDNSLTAAMVNVQVPIIKSRIGTDVQAWVTAAGPWFFSTLLQEFKSITPIFAFQGQIWARFSAQVWLEVADFEYGARALLELTKRVNEGTAPRFLS